LPRYWSCTRFFFLFQGSARCRRPASAATDRIRFRQFQRHIPVPEILLNTLTVSVAATVMALAFGFVMAWILTRTNVPGRHLFEQLMAVPYYLTPFARRAGLEPAWLAGKRLHQPGLARARRQRHVIDINTAYGIAWVMALFEGSVAFVMIAAVMKSMDPALEEHRRSSGPAGCAPCCGSPCPW